MFTLLQTAGTFIKGYGLIIAPFAAFVAFGYGSDAIKMVNSIMTAVNPITQALS